MTHRKRIWIGILFFFGTGIFEKVLPAEYEITHGLLILITCIVGWTVMISAAAHYIKMHPWEKSDSDSSQDNDWSYNNSDDGIYKSSFRFDDSNDILSSSSSFDDDIYFNPIYSFMSCNIYHHDD